MGILANVYPQPEGSPDPFAPDPTIFPPAPDWLFPLVMVLSAISVVVVIVLLVMWRRSAVIRKRETQEQPKTDWVDLSKLNKKGKWTED